MLLFIIIAGSLWFGYELGRMVIGTLINIFDRR